MEREDKSTTVFVTGQEDQIRPEFQDVVESSGTSTSQRKQERLPPYGTGVVRTGSKKLQRRGREDRLEYRIDGYILFYKDTERKVKLFR